jgi:hypothetical protein
MRSVFWKILCIAAIAVAFTAAAFAQSSGVDGSVERPFKVGETLSYEGKLSKVIGVSIAELTFTVEENERPDLMLIRGEARSRGSLLRLFRYSFLLRVDSVISLNSFKPLSTKKHDVQKERVRDSEAVFDYERNRVTYTETDPKEPMRPPRQISSDIPGGTHDMISAIYMLRMLPLAVGSKFDIPLSDSGLVYNVPVRVTKRERIKTALGRVWCFRVEPEIFGDGRLIERKGSMIIWVTDDARRIPIRSQVNTSLGKLEIRLRMLQNAAAPSQNQ